MTLLRHPQEIPQPAAPVVHSREFREQPVLLSFPSGPRDAQCVCGPFRRFLKFGLGYPEESIQPRWDQQEKTRATPDMPRARFALPQFLPPIEGADCCVCDEAQGRVVARDGSDGSLHKQRQRQIRTYGPENDPDAEVAPHKTDIAVQATEDRRAAPQTPRRLLSNSRIAPLARAKPQVRDLP